MRPYSRWAAVVAIIVFWPLLAYMMHTTGLKLLDSRPVSYLGVSSQAPLFKLTLVGGAVLVIAFYDYLRLFRPIAVFKWTLFMALACQLVTAALPYTKNGYLQVPHLGAAFILAAGLVVMPWLFSYSTNLNAPARYINRAITVGFLIVLVPEIILMLVKHYYSLGEIVNLAIFDGWLLYLTTIRPSSNSNEHKA